MSFTPEFVKVGKGRSGLEDWNAGLRRGAVRCVRHPELERGEELDGMGDESMANKDILSKEQYGTMAPLTHCFRLRGGVLLDSRGWRT